MDSLINLLPGQLLIIAVATYCIGMFLKSSEKVPDWMIPMILLVVAVAGTVAYSAISLEQGLSAKVIVDGIIYGTLAATIAVYCNQLIKQIVNRD